MKLPSPRLPFTRKGGPWTEGSFVNNLAGRTVSKTQMDAKKETRGYKMRRTYDEDYKRHAVALTLERGRRVSDVATELGINLTMLYEWRRQYAPQPTADNGVPQTPEEKDAEIRRLRAELVRMQEREVVLKKSLGILSETPESGMPRSKR